MEKISRRTLGKALLGSTAFVAEKMLSKVSGAKAETLRTEPPSSLLTLDKIEDELSKAATDLMNGFWPHEHIRNFAIEHYFDNEQDPYKVYEKLLAESAMYVPRPDICESVMNENQEKIHELARAIPEGKHGLFVSGGRQRLYVLQKVRGEIRFVKGYKCSTSAEEWSLEEGSKGTPPGLHWIVEQKQGFLGEAVSSGKYADNFESVPTTTTDGETRQHTMVRSLSYGVDPVAEMVTRRFLLWGRNTPGSRAINLHGTNRTDLLGQEGSGGCIRLSNVDIQDIAKYVDVGIPNANTNQGEPSGTPIMLHYGPVHYR